MSGVSGVCGDRTELAVDYKRCMPGGEDLDARLRAAMFAHLSRVTAAHPDGVPSDVINSFTFDGSPMRLLVQPGIRKPAQLDAALTIRTTWTRPGAEAPYADEISLDGSLRYKWRGTDPNHPDNRAPREAMRRHAPLPVRTPALRHVTPLFVTENSVSTTLRTSRAGEKRRQRRLPWVNDRCR